MPLDILCPSCRSSFPVTNAGREFHVECPSCDAGIGVSVEHPDAHRIGSVPTAAARLAAAPAESHVPATTPRVRSLDDEDDDAPKRGKGSTSAWVVIIGSTVGLLFVLAGVGTTGYFLFTNLDTDDPKPPPRGVTVTGGPNTSPATTTPPRVGGIAPRPNPITTPPRPNLNPTLPPGFGQPITPNATGITINPAATTPVPMTPYPFTSDDPVTLPLPGRVDQARVGGGGRYLVLTFQQPRKMVVYDLSSGKPVAEMPIGPEATQFTVGMNKLVVANPVQRRLKVYRFPEMLPDGEAPIPLKAQISGIGMGSGTNGPVFVAATTEYALFDLESLALVGGSVKALSRPLTFPMGVVVRASHNGKVFTARVLDWSMIFKVENGRWTESRVRTQYDLVPGSDGELMYRYGQLLTADGGPIGKWLMPHEVGAIGQLLPAVHGTRFVKLTETRKGGRAAMVTVHEGRDLTTPVVTIGEFQEMDVGPISNLVPELDRSVFLVPGAQVLAVIPHTKDKIVLRRVKLD